jgi:hypothetical protein
MPIEYIDSLLKDKRVFRLGEEPVKLRTHNGKIYRLLKTKEIKTDCCWLAKKVALIFLLAITALTTLGLIIALPAYRSLWNRVRNDLSKQTDKVHTYALHNLQNWCMLKAASPDLKLDHTFSIKKHWDTHLKKQWWDLDVNLKEIRALYNRLIEGKKVPALIGDTYYAPTVPTMHGTALLAHYISAKTQQENLYVCKDLQALKEELERVKNNPADQRLALVVPTYTSPVNPDKMALGTFQHAVSVCIEKRAGEIQICVLNSQSNKLATQFIHLEKGPFGVVELVLSYMERANLPASTKIYYSALIGWRQHGLEGSCSTFALRDAVAFLKDGEFFNNVQVHSGAGSIKDPFLFKRLPANFMKPTQSLSMLQDYMGNSALTEKSRKDLDASLDKHCVEVDGKRMNKHMSRRFYKYHLTLLFLLNRLPAKELNALIANKLILRKQPS